MKGWKFWTVLLFCCGVVVVVSGKPAGNNSENASTTESSSSSVEVSKPDMNIADYYYSIFGKHLDYDYREPILTFEEPAHNDLSEDVESVVDKGSDVLWNDHSRKKRFIVVPANFYNSTRSWYQQQRRLRMERRRLRLQRRQRWQQNRINYLNARSDSLKTQATRLTQLQQRQKQLTRSVAPVVVEQQTSETKTAAATVINSNKPTPTNSDTVIDPITSESKQVPVKQVPLPTKP